MIVNIRMDNIESEGKGRINDLMEKELHLILRKFKEENIDLKNWVLIEISDGIKGILESRTYILKEESVTRTRYVDILVTEDEKITPCYFKNHGNDDYTLFEASTVKQAIDLYESEYNPKLWRYL